MNVVLIAFFVKVALEITKDLGIVFYPDSYVNMCFEIAQVYLRLAASYSAQGSFAKRVSDKTFLETFKK